MYLIDRPNNRISRLEKKTFGDLGFREREHLQEWIANDPDCLGEELLIIQKEFDGFQDTQERLDLLAIDKQGNLVIIENKLDDSGRDVTWQVIKYASYCSSLSKEDVRSIYQDYLDRLRKQESAEEKLTEFLEEEDFSEVQLNQGTSQRIMMVAASFRKEVTSTVLWLMNFNMRIQCFKVTPYRFGDQLLLNFDQILPVMDAEEYSIKMASKAQEEIATQQKIKQRDHVYLEFWQAFLDKSSEVSSLFSNISPSKGSWLSTGTGIGGLTINVVVSGSYARGEIYFTRRSKEENKSHFDFFYKRRVQIEEDFEDGLTWQRMDDNKYSRIKSQLNGVSINDREDWPKMIEFMVDVAERLEKAFRDPVKQLKRKIQKNGHIIVNDHPVVKSQRE